MIMIKCICIYHKDLIILSKECGIAVIENDLWYKADSNKILEGYFELNEEYVLRDKQGVSMYVF